MKTIAENVLILKIPNWCNTFTHLFLQGIKRKLTAVLNHISAIIPFEIQGSGKKVLSSYFSSGMEGTMVAISSLHCHIWNTSKISP